MEVTEHGYLVAGCDGGNERRSEDGSAEQSFVTTFLESLLPEVLTIVALELADGSHSVIVENPDGLSAVRSLYAVEEIDNLISGDSSTGGCGNTDFSAAFVCKNTEGFLFTVTVEESILFLVANTAGKLGSKITLKVKGGVVEQLVGNLDDSADLVSINGLLTKDIITIGNGAFLVNPRSGALGGNHGNLAAAGFGLEYVSVATEDVLLVESLNKGVLEFVGNEIAALAVDTFLESIANLIGNAVLGAGYVPESILVGIRCSANLGVNLCGCGFLGDGSGYRFGKFSIHSFHSFHTGDFYAHLADVILHTGVDGIIFGREKTVSVSVRL